MPLNSRRNLRVPGRGSLRRLQNAAPVPRDYIPAGSQLLTRVHKSEVFTARVVGCLGFDVLLR